METPQLVEALEAVSNAVSSIRANANVVNGAAAVQGTGTGFGNRQGGPSGSSDNIPDYQRWKIVYEVDNIGTYKRQLDFFGIQIGVIASQKDVEDVWIVSNVSSSVDVKKTDRKGQQGILYFAHEKPRMLKWDQQIAKGVGVSVDGNLMVQFYPPSTRTLITTVEAEYLASVGKELKDVLKTNIAVEESGGGFQFSVQGCIYR